MVLAHPIREMMEKMDLEIEKYTSALSVGNDISDVSEEDDELQDEIDKLASAERLVSREISNLVSDPRKERMTETSPRIKHSPISPMHSVHTEVAKWEDKRVVQKQMNSANQATKRRGKKEKTPISISNIHEVHITTLKRDVRESPGFSQPSDEISNRKFGVSHREPPEETLSVDDRMHISSTENECVPELEEKLSLRYRPSIHELSFVEDRQLEKDDAALSFNEEIEFAALSEHCLQSRQMSAIEKTPQDGFAEVATGPLHKSDSSLKKKVESNKKSRHDVITWLSLPSLGQQRAKAKANAFEAEIEYGSQQEEEIDDKSTDKMQCTDIEQPDVHKEMVQSEESIATESTPSWVAPWISPISPKFNKTGLTSRIQSKVICSAHTTINTNLQSEVQLATAPQEDISSQKKAAYNLREVAVMVHILLTVSGGAVAIGFFR